jgi:hypothetical protein
MHGTWARWSRFAATIAIAASGLAPGVASADAIDGDWCKEGRQFSIRGPQITTPTGTVTSGSYDRHAFFYTDQDGGFADGAEVHMQLLNEETVRLFIGTPDSEGEIWQRCDFTS